MSDEPPADYFVTNSKPLTPDEDSVTVVPRIHLNYRRTFTSGGKTYSQMIGTTLAIDTPPGYQIEVTSIWLQYPYDAQHALEFRPNPAPPPFW